MSLALSLRRNGSTGIEWLWAFVRGGGGRDRAREGGRKATRVLIGMIPLICALCMLARAEAHSNLLSFYAFCWREWISAFGVQNLKRLRYCTTLACLFRPPCLFFQYHPSTSSLDAYTGPFAMQCVSVRPVRRVRVLPTVHACVRASNKRDFLLYPAMVSTISNLSISQTLLNTISLLQQACIEGS